MFTIGPLTTRLDPRRLRPTQLTVGKRKVAEKREELKRMPAKERQAHMESQLFPAVLGPTGKFYILDHHHEAVASLREGAHQVTVGLVCDLSRLSAEAFWVYLDHRSWVHCYDSHGHRRSFDEVPQRFEDMDDDPYRSLAASAQEAGAFAKPDEPFFEFLWANHFRAHIERSVVERKYERAVAESVRLARSKKSAFLPGWAGNS